MEHCFGNLLFSEGVLSWHTSRSSWSNHICLCLPNSPTFQKLSNNSSLSTFVKKELHFCLQLPVHGVFIVRLSTPFFSPPVLVAGEYLSPRYVSVYELLFWIVQDLIFFFHFLLHHCLFIA